MNFQGWEWIILLVALLLLFGAKKLPELARSLGASSREFKKGLEDGAKDVDADKATGVDTSAEES